MPDEFELIKKYFTRPATRTVLGVGDDAALVRVKPGHELVVAADMLLAGRHFLPDGDPYTLGHKALAVNLSDMAAMGATPRWALMSIALPEVNEKWLARFTEGWFALADAHKVALIGGDTTKGPLTLSVTLMGEVPTGQALRRSGAKVGDEIWVSGTVGDAALALAYLQRRIVIEPHVAASVLPRLHTPTPRIKLGQKLLGVAHSAIDISDGLLADLGHICEQSKVGAEIQFDKLPVSDAVHQHLPSAVAQQAVLAGGDDYELCFTTPAKLHDVILQLGRRLKLPLACIGKINKSRKLVVRDVHNKPITLKEHGFDHFR